MNCSRFAYFITHVRWIIDASNYFWINCTQKYEQDWSCKFYIPVTVRIFIIVTGLIVRWRIWSIWIFWLWSRAVLDALVGIDDFGVFERYRCFFHLQRVRATFLGGVLEVVPWLAALFFTNYSYSLGLWQTPLSHPLLFGAPVSSEHRRYIFPYCVNDMGSLPFGILSCQE